MLLLTKFEVVTAWRQWPMLGIIVAAFLVQPTAVVPADSFNRGVNAAWLGVDWVNGDRSVEEAAALADDLARRQTTEVYVFTSYMKPNGAFNPTYSHAAEFVHALKASDPGVSVQAWIGLPLQGPSGSGYVDLEDTASRDRIVSFCTEMVHEHGFDGIHLDPEPVVNGDTSVLALLDELRSGIGPDATISFATRRIWPAREIQLPIIAKFAWLADYYREIAQRVDQVAVMTYDSGLPLPFLYRWWVDMQVVHLSQALGGIPVDLFVGIPASEEWTLTHWPNAENMTSGLLGMIDGLSDPDAVPSAVTGVAIYPYWEVDANEWLSYHALWLNKWLGLDGQRCPTEPNSAAVSDLTERMPMLDHSPAHCLASVDCGPRGL